MFTDGNEASEQILHDRNMTTLSIMKVQNTKQQKYERRAGRRLDYARNQKAFGGTGT